jgi:hypothetical protein
MGERNKANREILTLRVRMTSDGDMTSDGGWEVGFLVQQSAISYQLSAISGER